MQNLPERFLDNMKKLLGEEEYPAYLSSFEKDRFYGLRVNTAKISVEDFLKISPFELKPVPWTENGFYYDGNLVKPAKHPYYFAGLYYLQEPSAMTPAAVMPDPSGMKVLDVCAAPGGKSTELAARMAGKGLLFSNDISNSRAQALLKNLELFGTENAVILSEDPLKMQDRFEGYFDRILIDAPCSGEGMFRKEPAVIKSWLEHGNDFYVGLQKQITKACLRMLKPGGFLVYSTCTFSVDEDENMILYMKSLCPELRVCAVENRDVHFSEGFPEMASVPDIQLKNCIRIFPHIADGEGHFVTLLQKGMQEETAIPESKIDKSCRLPSEVTDFLKKIRKDFSKGRFEIRGERLLYLPETLSVPLNGLRVMRTGLLMGEIKKGRFEPSQALAMALRENEFDTTVSLPASDERVIRYLKGETVDISDIDTSVKGYVLFCVDHYPLGFAKAANGMLKNKYLAGWRYQ